MKVTLNNVGRIEHAEIDVKPLTILVGGNNTGKTYAMYVLWNILQRRFSASPSFAESIAQTLRSNGTAREMLSAFLPDHMRSIEHAIGDGTKRRLHHLFRSPEALFSDAKVKIELDAVAVLENATRRKFSAELGASFARKSHAISAEKAAHSDEIIFTLLNRDLPQSLIAQFVVGVITQLAVAPTATGCVLLPAERAALNIFAADLDTQNAALLRQLKREQVNVGKLIEDLTVAQYAEPIEEYLRLLKIFPRALRAKGEFHDAAMDLQKQISKVRYKVDKDGLVTAQPYRSDTVLGLHLTSSTAKNVYGLWAYLEGMAVAGDCLMIDEPELNLHPDNQRRIARMLAKLVNRGIRVVVSTHSDYMIREFNNLLMLSQPFVGRDELAATYQYDVSSEALKSDSVSAIHFSEQSCDAIPIDPTFGIEVASMDAEMNSLNRSSTEIHFALLESNDGAANE